eukprot:TCONS_00063336-protein
MIPFELITERAEKKEDGTHEKIVLYNGRKVEKKLSKLRLAFVLYGLAAYGLWITFFVIFMEATERREGCSLDAVLEDDTEWECFNTITKEQINCHTDFITSLNTSSTNAEFGKPLKRLTKHVECSRLNLRLGEAAGLGYASYKLVFIFLIGLEKTYSVLRGRFPKSFIARHLGNIIFVLASVATGLTAKFLPSIFLHFLRYFVPFVPAVGIVSVSSQLGKEDMTDVAAFCPEEEKEGFEIQETDSYEELTNN